MSGNSPELLSDVAHYYSEKLAQHGETPQGVDWNGVESQTLRFTQLCKIISPENTSFSVNDVGCGYGSLLEYLLEAYPTFSYCGVDISDDMIKAAVSRHQSSSNACFAVSARPDAIADYCMASGIFNVRLDRPNDDWLKHIEGTLDVLHETSRSGFAFNCLTSYSDEEKKRDYLYYANPAYFFDFCKRRYSRQVALLHDYGLYEFTILVRK
ncbi:class I SAM-dependent methyltransferase [Chitiniphilus shinanonensis]|uniref:class I SAM-dependent methyltransferase n=1 Tax=Chitiniphilus shinanonensis TaxID=553088 RepID=UPI0030702B83